MEPPQEPWLSTAEAAQQLGITTATLYRLIDNGSIVAYRFGRMFRLKVRDVETFLERSRIKPRDPSQLPPHGDSDQ